MRVDVLPFQDVRQLHFDRIAGTVSNTAFRTDSDDKPVVQFACALLQRSDDIFPDIAGQPFVNGGVFAPGALQLIDTHGSRLNDGRIDKVLNSLLCWGDLHAVCLAACGVLQGSFRQKAHQRSFCLGDCHLDGQQGFL